MKAARQLQGENMAITKIEVERVSVISSKPFEKVVEALKAAIGRPDMIEFAKATTSARTFAELESAVQKGVGRTGLMLFCTRGTLMEIPSDCMGLGCFGPGVGVSDADAQVNELGKRRVHFPFIMLSSPKY
jgi:hypothetical protein